MQEHRHMQLARHGDSTQCCLVEPQHTRIHVTSKLSGSTTSHVLS